MFVPITDVPIITNLAYRSGGVVLETKSPSPTDVRDIMEKYAESR